MRRCEPTLRWEGQGNCMCCCCLLPPSFSCVGQTLQKRAGKQNYSSRKKGFYCLLNNIHPSSTQEEVHSKCHGESVCHFSWRSRRKASDGGNGRCGAVVQMIDICTMSQQQLDISLHVCLLVWLSCPNLQHLMNDIGSVWRIQHLGCNRWMR